jgi:hypothetical protein
MATLRFYIADLQQDSRGRWRSCISIAGPERIADYTASHQPLDWCQIAIVAEDHSAIEVIEGVDSLPDVPFDTLVDQAMRDYVAAVLLARGVEDVSWLSACEEYRDILNGIPVEYLSWLSYNADGYMP